jgi:putative transposase
MSCSGAASSATSVSEALGGVQLVISDQHAGLVAAQRRSFQGSSHQGSSVPYPRVQVCRLVA